MITDDLMKVARVAEKFARACTDPARDDPITRMQELDAEINLYRLKYNLRWYSLRGDIGGGRGPKTKLRGVGPAKPAPKRKPKRRPR